MVLSFLRLVISKILIQLPLNLDSILTSGTIWIKKLRKRKVDILLYLNFVNVLLNKIKIAISSKMLFVISTVRKVTRFIPLTNSSKRLLNRYFKISLLSGVDIFRCPILLLIKRQLRF